MILNRQARLAYDGQPGGAAGIEGVADARISVASNGRNRGAIVYPMTSMVQKTSRLPQRGNRLEWKD
ncbi:hypothetical protein K227x_13860 [Rubripirellula lacrimiformis]|uniref:Uncharacterized protein n=1 Tax=Rubripirellula lacrimiformis TaxID=1930273 RepID=A0A517N778_9BACT|nr:hypothetical protein K227x_13860 [Rubripirellula lacrimiformis]